MAISNTPQTMSDYEREFGGFPISMKDQLCGFAALAAVLAVTLPLGSAVQAAAPQQKTQAPGYYRFMLGDVEITA